MREGGDPIHLWSPKSSRLNTGKQGMSDQKRLDWPPWTYSCERKIIHRNLRGKKKSTMTVSKCSILLILVSALLSFLPSTAFVSSSGPRSSISATHSASMPSKPRTCHHLSPPTTNFISSGPNHSISESAAALHVEWGMVTAETAAQYGAGTCVLVLNNCLGRNSRRSNLGDAQGLQWLDGVLRTHVNEG